MLMFNALRTLKINPLPAVLLLLVLFLCSDALGQSRGRSWKRGPLTSHDFVASIPTDSAHFEYDIAFSLAGISQGMNTYRFCTTSALVYPRDSYLSANLSTDSQLNYYQTIFDIVEINSRLMQADAILLSKREQFEILRSNALIRLKHDVELLELATDHGRDSLALENIRCNNRQWLNDNPPRRPRFSPNLYWWSIGVEIGTDIPTGPMAYDYTPAIGTLDFSFAIGLGRVGLFTNYASGRVSRRHIDDYERHNIAVGRYDAASGLGVTVLDREGYSLTPYLSVGICDTYFDFSASYTLGVMGRYHFRHFYRIRNAAKHKGDCLTASAQGRLFFSYLPSYALDPTFSIGIRLGIALQWRKQTVEW